LSMIMGHCSAKAECRIFHENPNNALIESIFMSVAIVRRL
jgi:hypothetical protein